MTGPLRQITLPVRVRYAECDPMGVVHHSRYPIWFEMCRIEMLRRSGVVYKDLEAAGTLIVVAKLTIHYKLPAMNDDQLEVTATLTRAGGAKIEHRYEIRRDGQLICTAATVLACVGRDGRIQRVPEPLILDD